MDIAAWYNRIENKDIPVQLIKDKLFEAAGVELSVKRIDLINPYLAGNKWYKLKYNLAEAQKKGFSQLLTYGGAYSNHIYAVAIAGKMFGFETIGIIRGEAPKVLNNSLLFAKESGMKLIFVSREQYRKKTETQMREEWAKIFGSFYELPEGGTNNLAVKGTAEILTDTDKQEYDIFCTSVGTGGTLAGMIGSLAGQKNILGFSVLKGENTLQKEINRCVEECFQQSYANWQLNTDYHLGGYAKNTQELQSFMQTFALQTDIPVEQVYTGKLFYALYDLIKKGAIKNTRILALHTGGVKNHIV